MANVTYDLLWRETMRDLLDMLELDPPTDEDEDEAFQHFSYLYIKYVQIFKNLEDCYDQHVHPQKRLDVKEVLEAVMGRMLEIKQYLTNLSGLKFIHFDDILVDLKLIPETLELPVPRYFVDERQKDLALREKLVQTLIASRDADREPDAEVEGEKMSVEDAVRIIQMNERGRQGIQRARFMKEIRKQEDLEKKLRDAGQPETDPDSAAVVIQKLFRGFKTMKQVHQTSNPKPQNLRILPQPKLQNPQSLVNIRISIT